MDITDTLTAIAWLVVSVGTGLGALHKTCRTVMECIALGAISICAAARAYSFFDTGYVQPPDLLLSFAISAYVIAHVLQEIKKRES